jgi:hypothetical protein
MNQLQESSRKKTYLSFAVLSLLAISIAGVFAVRPSFAATTSTGAGVVIPLYNTPDSTWTTVAQTAKANPNVPIVVIMNPDSGPGSSQSSSFLSGVQGLQAAGVTVLGYVWSNYGSASTSSVESQISDYKSWYHVNGIFFDGMANANGYQSWYSSLSSYVYSLGMTFTMGNPGTSTLDSYIGTVNSLTIYENPGYPSISFITYPGYPASDFSLIAYGVTSYDASFVTEAASLVGYIYIDSLGGNNPYSTLSSYFADTVATLAALNPPASGSTSSTSSDPTSTTTSTTATSSSSTSRTSTSTSTTSKSTSSSSTATSKLKIVSQTTAGAAITGYYTVLFSQSGAVLKTGYTPATYTLNDGRTYGVQADSYGSCQFAYWQDTRSTNAFRSISITSNAKLVAVYSCS